MKNILVTGAAGFIGWKTAETLIEEGAYVIGIDNLNHYYDVRLKQHRLQTLSRKSNFEFKAIDIVDRGALEEVFANYEFDAVINLAAMAGVRNSIDNPGDYIATNVQGTLNLLDMMRHSGTLKMVLASTSSLYAGQSMPFNEELPVNSPISPYAASKKAAEALAYSYHFVHGLDISVVRYFTVYGPAGRPDMCIFRFIKWIDEGKPLELFGDGSQSRDFTYVDDVARGTIMAMKPVGYEVINLGGGKSPVTLNEIIKWIEKKLNKKAVVDQKPFNKVDIKETRADINKAYKLLGWKPETGIEAGMERTLSWHVDNRDWLLD